MQYIQQQQLFCGQPFFTRLRELPGTLWDRLARRWRGKTEKMRVFPEDSLDFFPLLFTAGWEWDGKLGSLFVDGMGLDFVRDFFVGRDGTGNNTRSGIDRGHLVGKSFGNVVGNTVVLPSIICRDLTT